MTRRSKLRGLYLLPLFLLALLFHTPGTTTHAQTMYGPLNLYSDIYWGTDGNVYANSQVVPSIYHYTHQYKANVKITAPNGATVTNVSPWSYNSAYTSTSYNFAGVYLDGVFINDSDGVGWCGVIHSVFATIVRALQTEVPIWVSLGDWGAFDPLAIGSGGSASTEITIPYTYSANAAGKTFTASVGMGLTGTLAVGDVILESGGGLITVGGPPSITAKYKVITTVNSGKLKAALNAYDGTAKVIKDTYKASASECSVRGG